MSLDHNHYCLLSFHGYNWWITGCAKERISVARGIAPNTVVLAEIDTSNVDWQSYCNMAVLWDERSVA